MIDFSLYLISDRTRCAPRSLHDTLEQACRAGVRGIQIREKDLSPREVYALVQEVQGALKAYDPVLLVNDRADIARATGIAGTHLPEAGLPPDAARRCLGPGSLIGVSTHGLAAAQAAEEQGADFITFGPVFHTPSKAPYGEPLGLAALDRICRTIRLPVFAIGGITPENARLCLDAGASGVAVISAILAAPDVQVAVSAFRASMRRI